MPFILTVGGSPVDVNAADLVLLKLQPFIKGGCPSFSFMRRGGRLPGLPDPYLGQTIGLSHSGTAYFTGDCVSNVPSFVGEKLGWAIVYQCLGLRNRGDYIPFTDSITGTDSSPFNVQFDNSSTDYVAARAGRTIGQILASVLTMQDNANALSAQGIGNYTSLSPPTLPAVTLADLATSSMTSVIPPSAVYVSGERMLGAIESFMSTWCPNVFLHIDPLGNIRFLDVRTFASQTLTMGTDDIEPVPLTRDVSDCFQQVEIRGQPLVRPMLVSTAAGNGGLAERFAHDGLNNTQAKAQWRPSDFRVPTQPGTGATATATPAISGGGVASIAPVNTGYGYTVAPPVTISGDGSGATATAHLTGGAVTSYTMGSNGTGYTHASVLVGSPAGGNQDNGTCTIPSTTTVTVTSSNPQTSWPADFWDQSPTGRHGWVFLIDPVATGVTQCFSAPIVANTALVAGGTSTLTLGLPMPINTYSTYSIYGQTGGASVVWCLYEVTNHVIGALMANQFQACVPYVSASGDAATLTSIPIGSVLWSASGAPPYTETPIAFTVQPTATPPTILFAQPTYLVAGSHVPIEVRALLAINAGVNQTFKPSSSTYEGTSHTVEGLTRRLVVTVTEWRDPLNTTGMAAYAQDILDSVKDAVMEGTVVYYGLFTTALTPGISINIAGDDGAGPYPTGWEASPGGGASNVSSFTPKGIPCVAVELEFLTDGSPLLYRTNLRLSNRRGHFGAGAYLRPPRTGIDVTTGLEGLEGVLLGANFGAAAIPNIATPSIDLPSLAAPSIANPSIQTPTLGGLLGGAMSPINVTPEMVDQGEFDLAQHLSSMGVPDALLGINPGGGAVAGAQGQNVPVADMANMVQAAMGGVPPDAAIRGVPQIQAEKELGAE